MNNINHRYLLGKGEVESSILSGSTTKPHELRASDELNQSRSATQDGTTQEHVASGRGKSVDSVHPTFRRQLRTAHRNLTTWLKRNEHTQDAGRAATRVLCGLTAIEHCRTPSIMAEDLAALERAVQR